jgi:hypothetical protein
MTMVDTPSTIVPKDTIKRKQITTTSSIIMYRDPIDLSKHTATVLRYLCPGKTRCKLSDYSQSRSCQISQQSFGSSQRSRISRFVRHKFMFSRKENPDKERWQETIARKTQVQVKTNTADRSWGGSLDSNAKLRKARQLCSIIPRAWQWVFFYKTWL